MEIAVSNHRLLFLYKTSSAVNWQALIYLQNFLFPLNIERFY